MATKKHHYHKSTLKRVQQVQALVAAHYEPGRQDRCKRWVWRSKVLPLMGISEKRFYEYLNIDIEHESERLEEERELRLF